MSDLAPADAKLSDLDLAALLCSRVCHDVISPVGAIANGLELIDDPEMDAETKETALAMVRSSAKTAAAKQNVGTIRELGDGAPFAHLSGMMNSMMIVFLVPLCGALTQRVTAYRMVTVGSLISALSVFFIVRDIGPSCAVPSIKAGGAVLDPLPSIWILTLGYCLRNPSAQRVITLLRVSDPMLLRLPETPVILT